MLGLFCVLWRIDILWNKKKLETMVHYEPITSRYETFADTILNRIIYLTKVMRNPNMFTVKPNYDELHNELIELATLYLDLISKKSYEKKKEDGE